MIKITVRGHEGRHLWDRVKNCLGLVKNARKLSKLKESERRSLELDLITFIANLGFGEYSSPAYPHLGRRQYFGGLDDANRDTLNLVLCPDEVQLVVYKDANTPPETILLGNAIGYSNRIPITEDAYREYCNFKPGHAASRFFLYKSDGEGNLDFDRIVPREDVAANITGYVYLEGIFFLPFLGYKTPDAKRCVNVEIIRPSEVREPDDLAKLFLDSVFAHIARVIPKLPVPLPEISRTVPKRSLVALPRFITAINPEENVGASILNLLGFQSLGGAEGPIDQPKLFLDFGDERCRTEEAIRFVQKLSDQQRRGDPAVDFRRLDDISRFHDELVARLSRGRTGRKKTTPEERQVYRKLRRLVRRLAGQKEKVASAFQNRLDEMAGYRFGSFNTQRRVLSEVIEFAGCWGLDLLFDGKKINLRVTKAGQFQVREAVRNGGYLYTKTAFPALQCLDKGQNPKES